MGVVRPLTTGHWTPLILFDPPNRDNPLIPTVHAPLRADQRPLYARAGEALKDLVVRGGYAPGDRLPSEIELSQRLGISRPTLREALRHLEEDSIIVRRHGVGTFVAAQAPVIETGLEMLESIDRIAERRGLSTEMEATIEERPAAQNEMQGLCLNPEAPVTVVTRVIIAEGQRIAHLTDIVPQKYLRSAEAGPGFHGSVLDACWLASGRRSHTPAPRSPPRLPTPTWPVPYASSAAPHCLSWRRSCIPRTVRWQTTRSATSCRGTFGFTS